MTKKIGILYICTGKYQLFWEGFYTAAQKYFLPEANFEKEYFVFTDAKQIAHEDNNKVHKIYQQQLPWPHITLKRYEIFLKALPSLKEMDYLFFFNANMLVIQIVNEDILPTSDQPLVFTLHPWFIKKARPQFTYEKNPQSLAYVSENEGSHYYMGGLNGGLTKEFLDMVIQLNLRIEKDLQNGIIAVWHDESHLNKYAVEHPQLIKNLPPEVYGWPQEVQTNVSPKIIILNKELFGGHAYLRGNQTEFTFQIRRLKRELIQVVKNFFNRL